MEATATRTRLRQVVVTVTEDGELVGSQTITYYAGQQYKVELVTPDGVDAVVVDRNTES